MIYLDDQGVCLSTWVIRLHHRGVHGHQNARSNGVLIGTSPRSRPKSHVMLNRWSSTLTKGAKESIALFSRRLQFVVGTLQLQRSGLFMRVELPTLRLIIL